MRTREELITDTFVALADTLVAEFDVIDFLHTLLERTIALLDADAGGIMLADQRGGPDVLAASSHEVRLVELFELQHNEGPCLEAFHTGRVVSKATLEEIRTAWPTFASRLEEAGYSSAQAVPMRLRTEVIGALIVFTVAPGGLAAADLRLAGALANVATVGLIQERTIRARDLLAEQLQGALNSRILIEQAKGALAERTGLGVAEAFTMLRTHARRNGIPLPTVAADVVTGRIDIRDIR